MMKKEELFSYAEQLRKELIQKGYPVGEIRKYELLKSIRTYGSCLRKSCFDGKTYFIISLNEKFLSYPKEFAIETILHEFIHTFPNCYDHRKLFKNYGILIGNEYNIKISRLASKEFSNRVNLRKDTKKKQRNTDILYTIVCLKCGTEWHYKRETKLIKILRNESPCHYRHEKCNSNKFWLVTYKRKNVASKLFVSKNIYPAQIPAELKAKYLPNMHDKTKSGAVAFRTMKTQTDMNN